VGGAWSDCVDAPFPRYTFLARLFETALREVDRGLVEAAQAMGATKLQIVTKVPVPEAAPGLVAAVTVTLVSLVGYSAMAGAVGAVVLATSASALGISASCRWSWWRWSPC
jgi:ABC-type methionine transport system permease subunit